MSSLGEIGRRDAEDEEGPERACWYCGGVGRGIVGVDWDTDDAINGPWDGEVQTCPNCSGSGLAEDCWFW